MVQNMILMPMASRNRRSARIADQATAIVAPTPPSDLAAGTYGMVQAAMNPTTDRTVSASPASQGTRVGEAQKEAARRRAADDGEEGPHFEQAVAERELFVGKQLGQNAVLGRAEERAVDTHSPQDDQGGPSARWILPERDGPGSHQRDFAHLHGNDDGPLAQRGPIARLHKGKSMSGRLKTTKAMVACV